MNNSINYMTTNIDTNTNSDINATSSTPRRQGNGLKAVVVILSLIALCLSYRAATEAAALYRVLDKVHDTLAHEQQVKAQVVASPRISETISPLAGL